MWHAFKKKLKIILPEYPHVVLKPSASELANFEQSFQIEFPKSYKLFMEELSPGEFNSWTWVISPLKAHRKFDLASITKAMRKSGVLEDIYGDYELIQSFIPFANTAGGDLVGWDRRARTKGEYEIICLPRHKSESYPLNQSFKEFIVDSCCGTYLNRIVYGDTDATCASQIEFRPFTKRIRT